MQRTILAHSFRGSQSIMVGKAWWEGLVAAKHGAEIVHVSAVDLDTEKVISSTAQPLPSKTCSQWSTSERQPYLRILRPLQSSTTPGIDRVFKHKGLWRDSSYSSNKKYTGCNAKKEGCTLEAERKMCQPTKWEGRCLENSRWFLNYFEGRQADEVGRDALNKAKHENSEAQSCLLGWSLAPNPFAFNSDVGSTEKLPLTFQWPQLQPRAEVEPLALHVHPFHRLNTLSHYCDLCVWHLPLHDSFASLVIFTAK